MNSQLPTARLRPFRPIQFGRYTLLAQLGSGGMGEIYLARMEGAQGFEKLCVIKKLLAPLVAEGDFAERFVSEARLMARLSHGSIAQVLDVGLHEGDPYIALEHVDGKDLRKVAARMRERHLPSPLTFVLYVMGRVLDALAYAHRKRDEDDRELNLVHRDISPQNILVSYEGEVKVIDFGLAKSTLSISKTNPSIILGKFLYMSPEQARHQPVDRRSDLYAVGLCLYELIVGKNPFDDVPPNELISHVGDPHITPLQEVDPLCPGEVASMVMKALAVDPAERFQSAEEFRGKLLAVLHEIDPRAGPETASRFMRETFANDYQAERRLLASARESLKSAAPAPASHTDETGVYRMKNILPPEEEKPPAEAPVARGAMPGPWAAPEVTVPRAVMNVVRPEAAPEVTVPRAVMPVVRPEAPEARQEPKSSPGLRAVSPARQEPPGPREEPKSSPGPRSPRQEEPKSSPGPRSPRQEAPGREEPKSSPGPRATPSRPDAPALREEPKSRSGRFAAAARATPAPSSEPPTEHEVGVVGGPPDGSAPLTDSPSIANADTDPRVIVGTLFEDGRSEPRSPAPASASNGRGSGPYLKSALPPGLVPDARPSRFAPQPPSREEVPTESRVEVVGAPAPAAPARPRPAAARGRKPRSRIVVVLMLLMVTGVLYLLWDLYGSGFFPGTKEPQREEPRGGRPKAGSGAAAPKPAGAAPQEAVPGAKPEEAKPASVNPGTKPEEAKPAAASPGEGGPAGAKPEETKSPGAVAAPGSGAAPQKAPAPPAPDGGASAPAPGAEPEPPGGDPQDDPLPSLAPSPKKPSQKALPKKKKLDVGREWKALKRSRDQATHYGRDCGDGQLKSLCERFDLLKEQKDALKGDNESVQSSLAESMRKLNSEFGRKTDR